MTTLWIGGAGGAPSNNVIRSLRESGNERIIGTSCVPSDLLLAKVDERLVVPPAGSPVYSETLLALVEVKRPDFLHVQNDEEVLAVSRLRKDLEALGVQLCLPSSQAVEVFVDKWRSYTAWDAAGLPVPRTVLVQTEDDLDSAFRDLGPTVWIRARRGGGGKGALPTDDPLLAERWIDRYRGWGQFTASEMLTRRSITWQSLWYEGELVAAQTRRRLAWSFGDRTLSGVTGITAVGETVTSPQIGQLATKAIRAVEDRPHGLYGVDMSYDELDQPRITEINVGRFFTTIYFFAKAGLNLPRLYVEIAMKRASPPAEPLIDPLEVGLIWVRGMDTEPLLARASDLQALDPNVSGDL